MASNGKGLKGYMLWKGGKMYALERCRLWKGVYIYPFPSGKVFCFGKRNFEDLSVLPSLKGMAGEMELGARVGGSQNGGNIEGSQNWMGSRNGKERSQNGSRSRMKESQTEPYLKSDEGSWKWMKEESLKSIRRTISMENITLRTPPLPSHSLGRNMEQLSNAKRRPSIVPLQPPELKPQQVPKHREADLPRTPYPMPRTSSKRSVSFSEQDGSEQQGNAKKSRTPRDRTVLSTPPHLANPPSLDLGYPSISLFGDISLVEMIKVWKSLLHQVDWSEIVRDVGGRKKPDVYRDVFKMIMESHIEELLNQGEHREDVKIEFGKRDNEDSDTEGEGFGHSEDDSCFENDESGQRGLYRGRV